ncbi:MFS transporter [Loigolactobacillus bifermentans]|uniref:MFS transporter n=1 Tax=Loigolactobacillus bifermentans TaxID=1607 RepID=UPI00070B544D|nr:MFS transporter [Loigolactobacillus bifermentans]QGG59876.1 hypothetical protein LB003_05050 [Loigolactobacillus bifermentans]
MIYYKIICFLAIQAVTLVTFPLFLQYQILGVIGVMILGLTMYLNNSPIQLHFMDIAEREYPQSIVIASAFNSIFSNIGIALESAAAGWSFETFGLVSVGPTGAIFAIVALMVSISLSKSLNAI